MKLTSVIIQTLGMTVKNGSSVKWCKKLLGNQEKQQQISAENWKIGIGKYNAMMGKCAA